MYNYDRKLNDIALIKLPYHVKFTEKIYPICLPNKDYIKRNMSTIITGWVYYYIFKNCVFFKFNL